MIGREGEPVSQSATQTLHVEVPAVPDEALGEGERRWGTLAVLCLAIVLSLATWFSATAVTAELQELRELSGTMLAWLTNGVQLGFVIGALAASLVNLPDLVRLNRLMAAAAALAALANLSLLLELGDMGLVLARTLTGFALAGVYPPALKLVSTWFVRKRGLALGAVIAALTLGSSLPHLFRALFGTLEWQWVVGASSLSALAGAVLFLLFAQEGPYPFGKAVFDPRQIGVVLRDRPVMLATGGYLGHMWELYAMWAWLLVYLQEAPGRPGPASLITFWAVAVGALGCLTGGVVSDAAGRTTTTTAMMLVSGACALLIGFLFDGPPWLLLVLVLVWGYSVVGDSAQFSVAVTELADKRYVGTALSLQLGLGFALTMLSIWLLPQVVVLLGGWRWVFVTLAVGPLFGVGSMLVLRAHPASRRLAGGKR